MNPKQAAVFAACAAVAAATAAQAQNKRWIYDVFVQKCRDAGKTPASSYEQFLAGQTFQCRSGPPASSGASSPAPPDAGGSAACREAKINIKWVFRDAGARLTYARNRDAGMSPLDAVVAAEGHNPHAQRTIIDCAGSASMIAQALGAGDLSNAAVLADRTLGSSDCACISVLPDADGSYVVKNSCDPLRVSVNFGGDLGPTPFPDMSNVSAWANAGVVSPGVDGRVRHADGIIATLRRVQIADAKHSFVCLLN